MFYIFSIKNSYFASGARSPDLLQANVAINSIEECKTIYNNTKKLPIQLLYSTQLCAVGNDSQDSCEVMAYFYYPNRPLIRNFYDTNLKIVFNFLNAAYFHQCQSNFDMKSL